MVEGWGREKNGEWGGVKKKRKSFGVEWFQFQVLGFLRCGAVKICNVHSNFREYQEPERAPYRPEYQERPA